MRRNICVRMKIDLTRWIDALSLATHENVTINHAL